MSYQFNTLTTDHEIIGELQMVQNIVDLNPDYCTNPERKSADALRAANTLPLDRLFGKPLNFKCSRALAKSEDIDLKEWMIIDRDLEVTGAPMIVGYLKLMKHAVDSLVLGFPQFELDNIEQKHIGGNEVRQLYSVRGLFIPVGAFRDC